ncbi:MAG: hypothetical protein JSV09_07605 [Thermoplasmata archaeon]|nr:MAG: hypothetical protein JSV09_07605 [Thermoplasmata archaeon]
MKEEMNWDLVLAILLFIMVPGILLFIILYIWYKRIREEEKISDSRERLEMEIKKKGGLIFISCKRRGAHKR